MFATTTDAHAALAQFLREKIRGRR
jgi:hypothetical protein